MLVAAGAEGKEGLVEGWEVGSDGDGSGGGGGAATLELPPTPDVWQPRANDRPPDLHHRAPALTPPRGMRTPMG